jgi:quercetin dioxygenase-like cupin family protein
MRIEKWSGEEQPASLALRRQLENEGYSVFEWSDAPGTVYGPHSHAEDQSHWILSGELELTVDGETLHLTRG